MGALSGSKASPEAPSGLRPSGYDPEREAWWVIDGWCAKQSAKLLTQSNQHIRAGRDLNDPAHRFLLGKHHAFGMMRSFIHGAVRPGCAK